MPAPSRSSAETISIALAQANPRAGDVAGNLALAERVRAEAARQGADVATFPELFLSGRADETLLSEPAFQDACRRACETLAAQTADEGPDVLVGLPWREGGRLTNAVAHLSRGRVETVRHKVRVRNERVFVAGPLPGPVSVRGVRFGVPIGEDLWTDEVVECLAETGAELLLSPAAVAYARGAAELRQNVVAARVVESGLPLVFLNGVGGEGASVFDGASFGLDADRRLAFQLPGFVERLETVTFRREAGGWRCLDGRLWVLDEGARADYRAGVLAIRDHGLKRGFSGAVIGLSGDARSALAATMAVDALGPDAVRCVAPVDRSTSPAAVARAQAVASALGARCDVAEIAPAIDAVETILDRVMGRRGSAGADDALGERAQDLLLASIAEASGAALISISGRTTRSEDRKSWVREGFRPLDGVSDADVGDLCNLRDRWKPDDALGPSGGALSGSLADPGDRDAAPSPAGAAAPRSAC